MTKIQISKHIYLHLKTKTMENAVNSGACTTERKMGPFDEIVSSIHNARSRIEEIAQDIRTTTDKVRGPEPNDPSQVEQAGEPHSMIDQMTNAVGILERAINELNLEKNRYREIF